MVSTHKSPPAPRSGRSSGWSTPLGGWQTPDRVKRSLNAVDGYLQQEREQRRQAIGGLDAAWLLLEKETDFSPVCVATYTYGTDAKGETMTMEKLERAMNEQAEAFPKYRQKLTDVGRKLHGPRFIDDIEFDMANHIRKIRLPGKAGKEELEARVARFLAEPFDLSRPLWDTLFVENYTDEDGAKSAMITRGHHTLADGQGFVASQLYITSYGGQLKKQMEGNAAKIAQAKRGQLKPSQVRKGLKPLDKLAANPIAGPLVAVLLFLLYWVNELFTFLQGSLMGLYHAIHQGFWFGLTLWRPAQVSMYYHGERVAEREFATSKAYPISDVKLVQKAFSGARPGSALRESLVAKNKLSKAGHHATLNDVCCACMTDVLRAECDRVPPAKGIYPKLVRLSNKILPSRIALFIPISVRKTGDWSMRNLSTGSHVFMTPMRPNEEVDEDMLFEHIHRAKDELSIIKKSLLPNLLFAFIQSSRQVPLLYSPLSALPKSLNNFFSKYVALPGTNLIMSGLTAVLTNVPGPPERCQLQGVDVLTWTALPPQAGANTVGLGLITYGGSMTISVSADHVQGSGGVAARICRAYEERFELYVKMARKVLEADKNPALAE